MASIAKKPEIKDVLRLEDEDSARRVFSNFVLVESKGLARTRYQRHRSPLVSESARNVRADRLV